MTPPKFRPFTYGVTQGTVRQAEGGVQYLSSRPLGEFPRRMSDRFVQWAEAKPQEIMFAKRQKLAGADAGKTGDWEYLYWGDALKAARSIGQALINRGLSQERPVAILSENDLEHAMIALACIYVGVPYVSVSSAYSLVSKDYEKLRHVLQTTTPGLIYAADPARYGAAVAAVLGNGVPQETEVIYKAQGFDQLLATQPTEAVERARETVDGDTIVKFLFTSGSTKLPKAVINTHRMWCANQAQMRESMPALKNGWHVLVDWLPWNHTFSGNHNFGLIMFNGGTIYIDEGKPVTGLIEETFRNLREISPTLYLNVPTGFEAIANAMKTDLALRKTLLQRVEMFFYAGAALAQPIWDSLYASQEAEIGERIVMTTGLGMTESSPFGCFVTNPNVKAGDLGLPTAGLDLKLVPMNGKVEIRYKGPNITPGYWRNLDATKEAFDEEGFFCTGDAVKWIDEQDIHQGLKFDGRIAEDFKLATGTFVSVGPMRAKIIAAGAPYVMDAVITGLNLKEVGAMLFPTGKWREFSAAEPAAAQAWLQNLITELAKTATGSATRVAKMVVLTDPPALDKGEVTDKGSINQRAVLQHRAEMVDQLHAGTALGMVSI